MGNTDSIPVLSQCKSFVQLIAEDSSDGALKTQKNFIRGCPVVSQVTSTVQLLQGDIQSAKETQMYCVKNLSKLADGIPVVGHVKGLVHYACGDTSGGNGAMLAATRTTGVLAGGIAGGLLGPVGAFYGGVSAGVAMDGILTGVDSAINEEFRPHGHVAFGYMAVKDKIKVGQAFDWVMLPVFDGVAAEASSEGFNNIRSRIATKKELSASVEKSVEAGKITMKSVEVIEQLKNAASELEKAIKTAEPGKLVKIPENTPGQFVSTPKTTPATPVASVVTDQHGQTHVGFSYLLRRANKIDAFVGEAPSVALILYQKLKDVKPRVSIPIVRGYGTLAKQLLDQLADIYNLKEPSCAEIHALHLYHRANGTNIDPASTVTVMHDGTGIKAVARCGSCKKCGKHVSMGEVPTDSLHGTYIKKPDSGVLNKSRLPQTRKRNLDD